MRSQLATNLVLAATTGTEVTQSVAMGGMNAAAPDVVATAIGTGDVTVKVQQSNDLENWEDVASSTATASNTDRTDILNVAAKVGAAYIRLHCSNTSNAIAVISVGVNTSSQ